MTRRRRWEMRNHRDVGWFLIELIGVVANIIDRFELWLGAARNPDKEKDL